MLLLDEHFGLIRLENHKNGIHLSHFSRKHTPYAPWRLFVEFFQQLQECAIFKLRKRYSAWRIWQAEQLFLLEKLPRD